MEGLAEGFIAILVALIIIKTPREKVDTLMYTVDMESNLLNKLLTSWLTILLNYEKEK